jgi:hypothetical protein
MNLCGRLEQVLNLPYDTHMIILMLVRGIGLTATPEIAQNVHYSIRKWLRSTYGDTIAEMIRIQYGGSVTPETVDEVNSFILVPYLVTFLVHTS